MATSDKTMMTKPTLDLEYQDGAGRFKILTADQMGWAIQLHRNQWLNYTSENIAARFLSTTEPIARFSILPIIMWERGQN